MFSVDYNLLIGILVFAAIFAYILILKKLGPKSILAEKTYKQNPKKDNMKKREDSSKEPLAAVQSRQTGSACSHYFGYLRTLPKNSALPDECLGCPKIINCLTYVSIKKSLGKQK